MWGEGAKNHSAACLDGYRNAFEFGKERISNADLVPAAMREQISAAARSNLKATIFDRRIGYGQPNRYHCGPIRIFERNTHVLMPVGCGYVGARFGFGQCRPRRLDADMLNGIGRDLGADQLLNDVKNSTVCYQPEHGRAKVHWCVLANSVMGQADVKMLEPIESAHAARGQLFPEGKTVWSRRYQTLLKPISVQSIQERGIFLFYVRKCCGVHQPVHRQIAVVSEGLQLIPIQHDVT